MHNLFLFLSLLMSLTAYSQDREKTEISLRPIIEQFGLQDGEFDAIPIQSPKDIETDEPIDGHPRAVKRKMGFSAYESFAANPSGSLLAIRFDDRTGPDESQLDKKVFLLRIVEGKPEVLGSIRSKDPEFKDAIVEPLSFLNEEILMMELLKPSEEHTLVFGVQFVNIQTGQIQQFKDFLNPEGQQVLVIDMHPSGSNQTRFTSVPRGNIKIESVRYIRNNFFAALESENGRSFLSYYRMDSETQKLKKIVEITSWNGDHRSLFWNPVPERDFFEAGQNGVWIRFSQNINKKWQGKLLKLSPDSAEIAADEIYDRDDLVRVKGDPELLLKRVNKDSLQVFRNGQLVGSWNAEGSGIGTTGWGTPIGVTDEGIMMKMATHPYYGFAVLKPLGKVEWLTSNQFRLIRYELDRGTLRGLTAMDKTFDFKFVTIAANQSKQIPRPALPWVLESRLVGTGTFHPLIEEAKFRIKGVSYVYQVARQSPGSVAIFDSNQDQWLKKDITIWNEPVEIIQTEDELVLWQPTVKHGKRLALPSLQVIGATYEDSDVACDRSFRPRLNNPK
jgi:hypothetical protein